LIVFIKKWKGEASYPGQDDQGHHVEPGADVGQAPQAEDELNSVKDALEEEKSAQLHDGRVGDVHQDPSDLRHLLRGDVDIDVGQTLQVGRCLAPLSS